jgi:hypothetical protein
MGMRLEVDLLTWFLSRATLRTIGWEPVVSNQILVGSLFVGDVNQHHQSSTSILFDVVIFRVMWDVTMD